MKIVIKFDVTDEQRRAFAWKCGKRGRATRRLIRYIVEGRVLDLIAEVEGEHANDPDVRRRAARKIRNLGPDLAMRRQLGIVE